MQLNDSLVELQKTAADGVAVYPIGIAENDVALSFPTGSLFRIVQISIDLNGFTPGKTITIRVYETIDGINLRLMELTNVVLGTNPMPRYQYWSSKLLRFTAQITVGGAEIAGVNIPYSMTECYL